MCLCVNRSTGSGMAVALRVDASINSFGPAVPTECGDLELRGGEPGPASWKRVDTEGAPVLRPSSCAHGVQFLELLVFDSLTFSLYLPISVPCGLFRYGQTLVRSSRRHSVTGPCAQRCTPHGDRE